MQKKVIAFSGSLRKESFSTKLLKAFGELAPQEINFEFIDISHLPVFNQDNESPEPQFLLDLKEKIKSAQGILLVTPEHNRSIPAALKNMLDWISRPPTAEPRVCSGKATGIAGISPYALGAVSAVNHLHQVLNFLNMPTLQQPEFYLTFAEGKFDKDGKLIDEDTKEHIIKYWSAFVPFIKRQLVDVEGLEYGD